MKSKKYKYISIGIKIILIIITIALCNFYIHSLSPEVVNELALYQMTNNPDSSSVIYLHSIFVNYIWVIPAVVSFVLFLPEIISIIKHIINKTRKEITKNEEDN